MTRALATAVLLLCALSLFAVPPGEKYKQWSESPEAYFMTEAERQQWLAVTTDEAAETFVNEFRARRGGDAFLKEVHKRTEMADKYLTIGGVKGSGSMRGKLVVLFGAPANIAVSDRVAMKGYAPGANTAMVTDLGVGHTAATPGGTQRMSGSREPGRAFRDFTFTFAASATPAFKGKDYVVSIETDTGTGKDRVVKGTEQKDLDAMFEAVAKASIKQ